VQHTRAFSQHISREFNRPQNRKGDTSNPITSIAFQGPQTHFDLLHQAGVVVMFMLFGAVSRDYAFEMVRQHPPADPDEFREPNSWFWNLAFIDYRTRIPTKLGKWKKHRNNTTE
jgi:hypothetical protein